MGHSSYGSNEILSSEAAGWFADLFYCLRFASRLFNYGIGIHLIAGQPSPRPSHISPKADHLSFQVPLPLSNIGDGALPSVRLPLAPPEQTASNSDTPAAFTAVRLAEAGGGQAQRPRHHFCQRGRRRARAADHPGAARSHVCTEIDLCLRITLLAYL